MGDQSMAHRPSQVPQVIELLIFLCKSGRWVGLVHSWVASPWCTIPKDLPNLGLWYHLWGPCQPQNKSIHIPGTRSCLPVDSPPAWDRHRWKDSSPFSSWRQPKGVSYSWILLSYNFNFSPLDFGEKGFTSEIVKTTFKEHDELFDSSGQRQLTLRNPPTHRTVKQGISSQGSIIY